MPIVVGKSLAQGHNNDSCFHGQLNQIRPFVQSMTIAKFLQNLFSIGTLHLEKVVNWKLKAYHNRKVHAQLQMDTNGKEAIQVNNTHRVEGEQCTRCSSNHFVFSYFEMIFNVYMNILLNGEWLQNRLTQLQSSNEQEPLNCFPRCEDLSGSFNRCGCRGMAGR
ncbi:unnamed protein product [Lactuca saligna]|uniref:Uncharacterized protein n=1 Tax=Lactuca saligna TaxID=75948 RepID=A0AA35YJE0_LACSI|nr:unnamed protein product [Lactuca saligna]